MKERMQKECKYTSMHTYYFNSNTRKHCCCQGIGGEVNLVSPSSTGKPVNEDYTITMTLSLK